ACRWAAANSGVPAKTMRRSELFMKWPCWLGKRLPRDHPGKEKACRSKPSDLKGSGVGLRLVQLLQFLADAVTLEVGQIIHEQLAIQVIALMLDADRQQAFTNDVEGLAVTVQRLDPDALGAGDRLVETGYREATFLHLFEILGQWLQLRIDENPRFAAVFREIDDNDAFMHVDLCRSQSNPWGFIHGFKHVIDQLPDALINNV